MKRVRRPKGLKAIMRTALLYDDDNENENLSATRAWASGVITLSTTDCTEARSA